MNESFNTYELIEKYCLDLMDDKEKHFFELEIEKNPALKNTVQEHKTLLLSFDHLQSTQFVHSTVDHIHSHSRNSTEAILNTLKLHVNRYWRTASVAASVAFIASILTFTVAKSIYKKETEGKYVELKNANNNLKNELKGIKKEVSDVKKRVSIVPEGNAKYTGTGFAINQNGYLVTNLHVINGFDKIFVFTDDNVGHQGEVVATDAENDLAILKISETGFKFNSKIPYSVKKATPSIAQRIYSLGFPKEDIVYNEGYISSITGFESDSSHFQLELPSVEGMSGSPIVDETGNVIGIISGKLSQTEGVTYAIKSKALLNLVKKLPEEFNANEINANVLKGETRANQVKKIQPFVCVVKVYNN